jgi:hypothetical protein
MRTRSTAHRLAAAEPRHAQRRRRLVGAVAGHHLGAAPRRPRRPRQPTLHGGVHAVHLHPWCLAALAAEPVVHPVGGWGPANGRPPAAVLFVAGGLSSFLTGPCIAADDGAHRAIAESRAGPTTAELSSYASARSAAIPRKAARTRDGSSRRQAMARSIVGAAPSSAR